MSDRHRQLLSWATVVGLFAIAGAAASCGGADSAQQRGDVRAAFAALREGFEARDVAQVCERLTDGAQRQVGSIGHATPRTCTADVRKYLRSLERDDTRRAIDPRIARIELDGDRATVVTADRGGQGAFAFAEEDGSWKLASLFGITKTAPSDLGTPVPDMDLLAVADTAGSPQPGRAVAARAGRAPCPRIEFVGIHVEGGCKLLAATEPTSLRLRTLAGDSHFGSCTLGFYVSVDAAGRLGLDHVIVGYKSLDDPCGDIQQCRRDFKGSGSSERKVPWRGRLRATADGDLSADVALCFDSCAGRLQGRTELTMTRDGRGWRLRADRAAVGRSGLQLTGDWRLAPDALRVTPVGSRSAAG